jgi:predicted TIM-barrel fold metal-dependent hydrolase
VLWHQGTTFVRDAPLIHARPVLIDEIARRFPELRMWVAHLGHPWCEELIVVIRKHPHVYADMSALETRPLQLYFAMMAAVEYGVAHKILFGTDYPFSTLEGSLAGLRRINDIVTGTSLPRIPEEAIEGIISRDTLKLVGLA